MLQRLHLQNPSVFFVFLRCTGVVFLWMMASISFAQKGIITGHIITSDGAPADFVPIKLDNKKTLLYTDTDGSYKIENVTAGSHIVKILTADTIAMQQTINIAGNDTVIIDFELQHITHQQLNEVMITAAHPYITRMASESLRLNAALMEVPQAIQVTNQQSIKDQGLITTADILKTAAGAMSFCSAGQDGGVLLRGSFSSNSILRNGIGAGYFYNQELDAAAIEKVEFIMGPAGFMISNTDPGGLVNIVTKQPQHERKLAMTATYGSWNMWRTTIDLGGEFKKKAAFTYRINAGIQHQQQPYRFGYLTKYFATAAVKYEINTHSDITFEYNYAHGKSLNDIQYLPTINGRFNEVPDNLNIVDPGVPGITSYDHYFRLNFNHRFSDKWSLNVQLGNTFGAWKGSSMSINTEASVSNDTIYRYLYADDYGNRLYTATVLLKGTFNMGQHIHHSLLIGIDFGSSRIKDTYDQQYDQHLGLYYPYPVYYLPKDSVTFHPSNPYSYTQSNMYDALYVQDHIKCYDKFIVTIAARWTNTFSLNTNGSNEKQRDMKLTPRLGFTYLWNNRMSSYIMLDQGFMPQVGKSFDGSAFAPLTGINKEIGWKSYWLKQCLSLSIALYHTTRNNVLVGDMEHSGFQTTLGQIVAKGIELNINGQLSRNFSIVANYTYSDARVTKSNDVTQTEGVYNFASPVHNMVYVFLNYSCLNGALKGLSVGASVQHVDKMNASQKSNALVGGYTLLHASAAYNFGRFNINLNVYNLANSKYITYGYQYNETDFLYTPGQPIHFRLGLGFQL